MSSGGGSGRDPAGRGGGTSPPDPTMEDILASIRRILSEDEAGSGTSPATPPPPAPQAEEPAEPLALTEDMLVEAPPAEAGPPHGPHAVPEPAPPAPKEAPAMPEAPPLRDNDAAEEPQAAPGGPDSGRPELLAPAAAAAAAASVSSLLRTIAAERNAAVARGGPTLEDLVREEIRPLLKEWLDQHLPPLVERLVRAEIERVVGRALS